MNPVWHIIYWYLTCCAWEKWLKRFGHGHQSESLNPCCAQTLNQLNPTSGFGRFYIIVTECPTFILLTVSVVLGRTWVRVLWDTLQVLYPLSLPHGNDQFYDHGQISSATFPMHSLLSIVKSSWSNRIIVTIAFIRALHDSQMYINFSLVSLSYRSMMYLARFSYIAKGASKVKPPST